MKKLFLLSTTAILIGGFATLAIAETDHDHHDEAPIQHYEAQSFENVAAAKQGLIDNNAKIAELLKSETLSGAQLEKIHEISYTLENAIDTLIAEKAGVQAKLESVDEAVQAIHHASEDHEESHVREWFPKLEQAVADLDSEAADAAAAQPATDGIYNIVIKDHKFTPDEIRVPAGKKIKLVVDNQDPTPEEFESDDMRREKIIAGNSQATIFVGPLEPGKYHFFGEFNLDSANGYVIAE
ncbi:MAG: DUF6746 family protein [Bdellovibrionales bacterium]